MMEGSTSKEIGRILAISHRTVEIYRARLMRKYGAATSAELVHKLTAG
jgi:DNA-binding CsgD family transcriptional regulator